jgi:hypothetical protein
MRVTRVTSPTRDMEAVMTTSRGVGRMVLALSIAGWVSGCTSGSGPATVSGTSQTLSGQLAQAFCTWQAACGGVAPDGGQNPDAAATSAPAATADGGAGGCLARADLAAEQQLALLATAYSEGLVTINVTVAQACADAYQTRACGGAGELNVDDAVSASACEGLFVGYIPVGERCDMSAECLSGTYCLSQATGKAITSVTGAGTLGVCFPYQTAGETCNSTDDCLPPLACSPTAFVCQ